MRVLLSSLFLAAVVVQGAQAAGPRPRNTAPPVVSGAARVGSTLSTTTGTWTGDEPMTFTFAWRRCNARGHGCADIAGAYEPTYTLDAADEGSTIRSVVTATNSVASKSADSDVTAVVLPPALVVTKTGAWAAEGLVKSQVADATDPSGFRDDGRIYCGFDCTDDDNSSGRLVAEPYEYARWGGWSGACSSMLLACEFFSSPGSVSATASFSEDGRTPATCDGAAGPAVGQITGSTPVGYDVDWQSATRIGYDVFRAPNAPVLLIDRDGSCGLGSAPEKLFYRSTDTTPVYRYHQPGRLVAPDSKEFTLGHGRFSFSPDGTKIVYGKHGLIQVADALTGGNVETLGYVDPKNLVVIENSAEPAWSPDGSKIAFRGIEVRDGVYDAYKEMIVVYPGQGPRWTALDLYGEVCAVWKTNDQLYAKPIVRPGTSELNDQLGAVDMAGNVTLFGRHNHPGCPASRSDDGKIVYGIWAGPQYNVVADAGNGASLASFQVSASARPTLSPDGSKVAWLDQDPSTGSYDLVAADANGGPVSRLLTANSGFGWSRASDVLAVVSRSTGSNQVYVVTPTTKPATLLERFAPELRFDAQEAYRADSPASITDSYTPSYTNRLRALTGETIAASDPADPAETLSLDYLRPTYPSGRLALASDYVDENDDTRVADAQRFHTDPAYANRIYGRKVPAADGGTLLQYWFFYYDNPKTFYTIANHEGDWEMIQVRLDAAGDPVGATFAQHKRGEYCLWDEVEHSSNGRPIVYVAHESHASYFTAGEHAQEGPGGLIVWDYADGAGDAILPTVVDVTTPPEWMKWPGHWGGTFTDYVFDDVESPLGPYHQRKWQQPEAFESEAGPCTAWAPTTFSKRDAHRVRDVSPQGPPAPRVTARRAGRNVVIDYAFDAPAAARTRPWLLVTTVDGVADAYAPTNERTFLRGSLRGRIVQPVLLSRGPLRVLASARATDGARSKTVSARVR